MKTSLIRLCLLLSILCLAAPGCASSDSDSDTDEPAGAPQPDAGVVATTGTLQGVVTRSADPTAGGIGHVYVAVFAQDPVAAVGAEVELIGRQVIEDADMNPADVALPYAIPDVPPRSEPYFVIAFLDDNGTVDLDAADAAGPDQGDLVGLDGVGSPSVVVDAPATVTFDLDLNLAMPF